MRTCHSQHPSRLPSCLFTRVFSFIFLILGHILKAGLDPGPWTLDSRLWTLDSGFFSSQNFIPPQKKPLSPPPKNLYISPMKLPPPPINISSPKYSVRVFKQTTLFPPPTSSKKPLCLPLKTAPSQKTPLPSPK